MTIRILHKYNKYVKVKFKASVMIFNIYLFTIIVKICVIYKFKSSDSFQFQSLLNFMTSVLF